MKAGGVVYALTVSVHLDASRPCYFSEEIKGVNYVAV